VCKNRLKILNRLWGKWEMSGPLRGGFFFDLHCIHQIYRVYRWWYSPHILQILFKITCGSVDTTVELQFTFSSEHPVVPWIFSNNDSNFAQLFHEHFKRFSNECQLPSWYLNWVFKEYASCSNTGSKFLSKLQDCLINDKLLQIIPCRYQGSLHLGNVGRFWCVKLPSIAPHTW